MPHRYTADVTFKDSRGKKSFSYTFEIDWQVLIDRGFVTVYNLHDVARALADLRQTRLALALVESPLRRRFPRD